MAQLPKLADRAWYAHQCLPRDPRTGKPPSYSELEASVDLARAVISKLITNGTSHHTYETMTKLARALNTSPGWLFEGIGEAPLPALGPDGAPNIVVPRPGAEWQRYGSIPGWDESVKIALADTEQKIPPEAFLAGAYCAVYRPVDRITPELAIAASKYAWEFSTPAEQTRYSGMYARQLKDDGRALRKRTK